MSLFNVEDFRVARKQALEYLRQETKNFTPEILIILGTGLGHLATHIQVDYEIDYARIPNFPLSTVESHSGKLLFGTLSGKKVVAMQGRFHYYEGYAMHQIVFPVRVLFAMGAKTLFVSNACGGVNPIYEKAQLMLIDDHINMIGDNPLIGPNDDELGPRFPDMSEPYSKDLGKIAEDCALELGIKLHKGVYVAVSGPNMETRAEYRFLRTIGADVVGMSTVPEVIAANHMGMKVLGFSVITDMGLPDALEAVALEDVLAAAAKAQPNLTKLIEKVLDRI